MRATVNDNEFPMPLIFLERDGINLENSPPMIPGRFYVDDRKPFFDGKIRAGTKTVGNSGPASLADTNA